MKQRIACLLEMRGKRWLGERTLVWIVTSDWLRKQPLIGQSVSSEFLNIIVQKCLLLERNDQTKHEQFQSVSNLNFGLARDQVVHLETAVNLCATPRQGSYFSQFFLFFELRGTTKRFMPGPTGNSEFCFPSTQHSAGKAEVNIEGLGETRLTVCRGTVIKYLLTPFPFRPGWTSSSNQTNI